MEEFTSTTPIRNFSFILTTSALVNVFTLILLSIFALQSKYSDAEAEKFLKEKNELLLDKKILEDMVKDLENKFCFVFVD